MNPKKWGHYLKSWGHGPIFKGSWRLQIVKNKFPDLWRLIYVLGSSCKPTVLGHGVERDPYHTGGSWGFRLRTSPHPHRLISCALAGRQDVAGHGIGNHGIHTRAP